VWLPVFLTAAFQCFFELLGMILASLGGFYALGGGLFWVNPEKELGQSEFVLSYLYLRAAG